MNRFLAAGIGMLALTALPVTAARDSGTRLLFDGKSLAGWQAPDLGYWSVEDGAITARSTEAKPCKQNQFLVWQGGDVSDFVLQLKFRIQGPPEANSGIQIRSKIHPDGHAEGYQADIDRAGKYLGSLYDEHTPREMLASRGQRTVILEDGKRETETKTDADALFKTVNLDAWNDYRIEARGNRITLRINGKQTAEVIDRQPGEFDAAGKLALQLHSGPPTTVQFKEIRLKPLGK
jgi:hypothetical protein